MAGEPKAETRETLAPLISEYLRVQRSTGRMGFDTARKAGYKLDRLSRSFGARPLNQLTVVAVERWLAELEHLAPATLRLDLSTVRAFCGWLVRRKHLKEDPTATVRLKAPRRVPRALRSDAVTTLLRSLPDERARAIVSLMAYCGLRCIEVSRLRWADYDDRERTLLVRGKGGHERVLPVPEPAADALAAYRASGGLFGGGPLIRAEVNGWRGDSLTAGTISTYVARWMSQAGIKGCRFDGVAAHALRHTCASDVLDSSGDLRAVQELLGHQDLNTTAIYLRRVSLDTLREAMNGRDYG